MTTSIFTFGYLVFSLIAIGVWSFSRNAPQKIAPLGTLLRHVMQKRTNRIALIAIWWWVGWHFFGQPWPN